MPGQGSSLPVAVTILPGPVPVWLVGICLGKGSWLIQRAPNCVQMETDHWSASEFRVRKDLLGGIGDLGLASSGQALLPRLAVNANEVTTRDLSLTPESTGGSIAKATATQ